jgi:hypothetical protein
MFFKMFSQDIFRQDICETLVHGGNLSTTKVGGGLKTRLKDCLSGSHMFTLKTKGVRNIVVGHIAVCRINPWLRPLKKELDLLLRG